MARDSEQLDVRTRLLDAALGLVRSKGYTATTDDEICTAAGVTKGAFFHHFRSKDELAVAAVERWSTTTGALFAGAPYHEPSDPVERVLAYIDFRRSLIAGEPAGFTCFAGTLVQEMYDARPAIRDACAACIRDHAATLVADIAAAMRARGLNGQGWTAESLALHTQAVLQGAFILAKANGGAAAAIDSVDHLRRYVELLFGGQTLPTQASPIEPTLTEPQP